MPDIDPSGRTVIILAGEFAGEEGTCLGRSPGEKDRWAVSPNSSDQIVNLLFEKEFGVILNSGQEPGKN